MRKCTISNQQHRLTKLEKRQGLAKFGGAFYFGFILIFSIINPILGTGLGIAMKDEGVFHLEFSEIIIDI